MNNIVSSVEILKEKTVDGRKYYETKMDIDLSSYYKTRGNWHPEYVWVEDAKNKAYEEIGYSNGYFNEKYEDQLVGIFKKELFGKMNSIREMKEADPRMRVKHFRLRIGDKQGNKQVVFDSKIDVPGYWKLPEQTLKTIVDNINFEVTNKKDKPYESMGYVSIDDNFTYWGISRGFLIDGKLETTVVDKKKNTITTIIETEEDIAYNEYLEMWG